ncbi:MAG TPA: LysR family transcriptional regulator [Polyangiaceae bacterium]|nr:LysR family transcriptional regulator [Polyangiaceae bacterium]
MLPDLETLRCFLAAVRAPNFRSAASAVALSPAAFGERIKLLEQQLGAPLFERTTRRKSLTAAGERLAPQAQRCLDEAQRCQLVVQSSELRPSFELTIGTRFELGMSWLVPALPSLERARPDRRLHLYFADSSDLLPRIMHDQVDCMVTSARLSQRGLGYARLQEERYVFVGNRELLRRSPVRAPEHASSHVLFDVHPDLPLFRYFLDGRPAGEDWQFQHQQCLGAIAPIRARVVAGAGVAVLPLYYVERDLKAGRLRRVLPQTALPSDWFRLVWRSGHPREAELRALAVELATLPLR